METQTRLSRHNKFISAENIVGIFSVSSDDSFYMLCIYPHIFYVKNNPHLLSLDTDWIIYIYIYIYIYILISLYPNDQKGIYCIKNFKYLFSI